MLILLLSCRGISTHLFTFLPCNLPSFLVLSSVLIYLAHLLLNKVPLVQTASAIFLAANLFIFQNFLLDQRCHLGNTLVVLYIEIAAIEKKEKKFFNK
ncbi:hypothetical protein T4B_4078 [Trichinella pseudospiralis]|uniref:Uncharacterized protein n=1 Tax=Trichinella pseudospiralis TaxID=6337 RepID=A0A0V1EH48_TRIPS|nr:hypothetical protein T4A_12122 [Trichinella pseudospiralis]KRZ27569.1 hypothetical protein T4B_4078 [Trichinella pseudospiralis]